MSARRLSVLAVFVFILMTVVGAASAASVTISGTLDGLNNPSDEFIILMEAGDSVHIRLVCDRSTPLDPYVGISGSGTSAGDDDSSTPCQSFRSSELTFTAPHSGTYTVRVTSFAVELAQRPGFITASGGYTLFLNGDFTFLAADKAHLDNRVNNTRDLDTAAPVAVYMDPLEVFSINPETGEGQQVFTMSDEDVAALGIPDAGSIVLAESASPFTGHAIILSRLSSGEYQLNTVYTDGKDYIITWDEDGEVVHLAW